MGARHQVKWKANPFTNKAGENVFFIRNLFKFRGWRVRLHKFTHADDPGCFHSHPAVAYRLVLWGGYIEEMEFGTMRRCGIGFFSKIEPDFVHRIHELLNNRVSISLWIRGPITHQVRFGCIEPDSE